MPFSGKRVNTTSRRASSSARQSTGAKPASEVLFATIGSVIVDLAARLAVNVSRALAVGYLTNRISGDLCAEME